MKYIKLLIINLFISVNLVAVSYQERFLQANEYYKNGDYQKAEELYESIPNKAGALLYNLGNCAYKQDKKGLALAYWKKAEKRWGVFNKEDLSENIALIEDEAFPDKELNNVVMYGKTLKNNFLSFIKGVPLFILQLSFLALWIFLFMYLRYLYKKKRTVLIVFLFLLIAFFGTLLVIKYSLRRSRSGIVVNSQAKVFSGPDEKFSILDELPEVLEVMIKKEADGYYKIYFDGKTGWIKGEDVAEI